MRREDAYEETRALLSLYAHAGTLGEGALEFFSEEFSLLEPIDALESLATIVPTSPSKYARRIDSITRYVFRLRERDEEIDPELIDRAFAPLYSEGIADERTRKLAAIVLEVDARDPETAVHAVVEIGREQGVIPGWLAETTFGLCQGSLVDGIIPDDPNEKVAKIDTCFCITNAAGLTVSDFREFLDPIKWPECSGFWCSVTMVGDEEDVPDIIPGTTKVKKRVTEVVGLCPDAGEEGLWTITACLDVTIAAATDPDDPDTVTRLTMSYDVCRDADGNIENNNDVDVDKGVIVITQPEEGHICIQSSKVIHFTGGWEGQSSASSACAIGWADAAIDMAFQCLEERPADGFAIERCKENP